MTFLSCTYGTANIGEKEIVHPTGHPFSVLGLLCGLSELIRDKRHPWYLMGDWIRNKSLYGEEHWIPKLRILRFRNSLFCLGWIWHPTAQTSNSFTHAEHRLFEMVPLYKWRKWYYPFFSFSLSLSLLSRLSSSICSLACCFFCLLFSLKYLNYWEQWLPVSFFSCRCISLPFLKIENK